MGIPDSNIIVMMGDDAACNARNVFAGTVYHSEKREVNVYGDDVEVDYRGYEVRELGQCGKHYTHSNLNKGHCGVADSTGKQNEAGLS